MEIMSPAKGWIQQALQVSSGSKAVFHGIAALSSANLAMVSISHPTFAGVHKPDRYSEALNQYSKTIVALHREIGDVIEGHAHLEPVLLTCLLLMCYELHADRASMAIRHHTLGHNIVKKRLNDRPSRPLYSSRSPDSLQQLAGSFSQLAVGSNYPVNSHASSAEIGGTALQSVTPLSVPHGSQLFEAWDELDQLIDGGNQLLNKLYQSAARHVTAVFGESLDQPTHFCLTSCWSRSLELLAHDSTLVEINRLLLALGQWAASITSIQVSDPQTARALSLLQIRQWMSYFTLVTCRETRDTSIDAHEPDFVRVLDLAQFYLESNTLAPRPTRPRSMLGNGQDDIFCLEEGVLPALYLISLKSRTSATRHRAVELLANANRREGLASSTIIAQIAGAIVRVEEERAKDMVPALYTTGMLSHQVSEAVRFTDIVHAAGEDLYRPTCRLVCARYLHESGGSIEIVEFLSKGPCFPYSKCAGKCRTGFHFEVLKEKVRYDLA
jgi:hypothetical protein